MNYQELQEAKQTFRLHAREKEYKPLFRQLQTIRGTETLIHAKELYQLTCPS